VAAGRGSRFGGYKQFALLLGRPVLYYSLAAFERCAGVVQVVVVVPRARRDAVLRLCRKHGLDKVAAVVPGGAERTDSVRLGLAMLPESGLVAVHDAVRPLLTTRMLDAGFRVCARLKAVTFGLPATDTLKLVRGTRVVRTLDRNRVVCVQTPQFFDLALLRRAHARAGTAASDDCALVESMGQPVHWIPTPAPNPKLTTRTDLAVCAALLGRPIR
jgi:2-C-methyl-D-erythritol 4-phosphate cytidylyltransferase